MVRYFRYLFFVPSLIPARMANVDQLRTLQTESRPNRSLARKNQKAKILLVGFSDL